MAVLTHTHTGVHVVEWNPTGDVWSKADLLEARGADRVIRLHENGQVLLAEARHVRPAGTGL